MFPVSIVNTIYRFRCVSVEGSSIKNWWWEQEVPQKKKNKLQFDVSCHHSHDTIFFFSSSHWSAWVFEDHSVVLNHNTSRGNQTMGGKGEGNFKKREGVNADLERSKKNWVFLGFFTSFFSCDVDWRTHLYCMILKLSLWWISPDHMIQSPSSHFTLD